MFRNYIKSAFRGLVRNKGQAGINMAGLSVGMAVAILIGLWVWDELSFNHFYKDYDHIAQIARKEINNGEIFIGDDNNHFPIPLAAELRTTYGNYFKEVALASPLDEHIFSLDDRKFSKQGMFVEPDFTQIFTLKMVAGNASGLSEPNTILLARSLAMAFFGNTDPVGKVLNMDNRQNVKVAGVFENMPDNAKFSDVSFFCPFSLLVSSNDGVRSLLTNWESSDFFIYARTTPDISMERVSSIIKLSYWSKLDHPFSSTHDETDIFLNPMKDWHLRSEWKNGVHSGGKIEMVWLFGIIGIFVLFLACINFMNLSTARSEKKAKEVGIRKTIGSSRAQLVNQFLIESFVVVLIAFVLSLIMIALSLSWFNRVADKKIAFPYLNWAFWAISILFMAVTAMIAGSYPALYLSSFKPIKVLKGAFKTGNLATIARKSLVTLQFTVSIVLIIATIVIYRQIRHAQERPIGYDRNGLITIRMTTSDLYGKYDVLRKELLESGGAIGFGQSTSSPATKMGAFDDRFEWQEKDPAFHKMAIGLMAVTYDFGKTVGWQFVSGRDFSESFPTDTASIILNEAAVRYMRLKNPIGEVIQWVGKPRRIVGVIKDMITESPYAPVQQNIFFLIPGVGPFITIRLNPKMSAEQAIIKIESVFKKYNPSSPFDYTFVDEAYGRKFAAEQSISKLSVFFASLAIFISCLGIFGLASFIAERRTKEIGVRKILGASVLSLWSLLSREFLVLVAIAFLFAIPVSYAAMSQWLQKYEYHTHLAWWFFAVAGGSAFAITLLTASYQTVKAALLNPVKSLRAD